MKLFSSVIAELSAEIVALLPPSAASDRWPGLGDCYGDGVLFPCVKNCNNCGAELNVSSSSSPPTAGLCSQCLVLSSEEQNLAYKARFLELKLQELYAGIRVVCVADDERKTESLKLCGTWDELTEVYSWLQKWVEILEPEDVESADSSSTNQEDNELNSSRVSSGVNQQPKKVVRKSPRNYNCTWTYRLTRESTKSVALFKWKRRPYACKTRKTKTTVSHLKPVRERASTSKPRGKANRRRSSGAAKVLVNKSTPNTDRANQLSNVQVSSSQQCHPKGKVRNKQKPIKCNTPKVSSPDNKCPAVRQKQGRRKRKKTVLQSESNPLAEDTKSEVKCEKCDYSTMNPRNLTYHIARMHSERKHACTVCSRKFGVAKDLRQHMKFHDEHYCCEHCGRTVKSRYALSLHIARIHNGVSQPPAKRYLCTSCGKFCRSKTDYTVHRNREHTGLRPFRCDVCGAEFFARTNLRAHSQIHSEVPMFPCKLCDKAFKQRQGLRVHLAVHAVERPYRCDQCTKTFTQRSALIRHLRTHSKVRPYLCRLCGHAFNDYSILRRHMLGIHKMGNTVELRDLVKAACADAREFEQTIGGHSAVASHCANQVTFSSTPGTSISDGTNTVSQVSKDLFSMPAMDLQQSEALYVDLLTGVVSRADCGIDVSTSGHFVTLLPTSTAAAAAVQSEPSVCTSVVDSTTTRCYTVAANLPQCVFMDTWKQAENA